MHPRNQYLKNKPDFRRLAQQHPRLMKYFKKSKGSIDFKDPNAIRELTYALLSKDFGLKLEIPLDSLCPPIPSRLDYILHIEDLLEGVDEINGIDIGTGASCIYPLLACSRNPNWSFTALETNARSIEYAQENVTRNKMASRIQITNKSLLDVIQDPNNAHRQFHVCLCNPPFYASQAQIDESRLFKTSGPIAVCNGSLCEMVTSGGEYAFISNIIQQSHVLKKKILWYTSLVGIKRDAERLYGELNQQEDICECRLDSYRQGVTVRWILSWRHS